MGILDQGIQLIRNGKLADAEVYFCKLIEAEPRNDGLYRFLGRVYAEQGHRDKAVYAIEKAISLKKDQPMWLYKLLVENKLEFIFIKNANNFLSKSVVNVLSDPSKIEDTLKLNDISYPGEIYQGNGLLGKKIMFHAIENKNIHFISPFTGKVISSNKSITEYAYYFDEGFILTFFSDWAYPFLSYQIFIIKDNRVFFGYLDKENELHCYDHSSKSFLMYYANLMRVMHKHRNDLIAYFSKPISRLIVKNQNYRHLGHAIWNGLSALAPFINQREYLDKVDLIIPEASVLNSQIVSSLFDTHKIVTYLEKGSLESFIYETGAFLITLKDNYVHNSVATKLVKGAIGVLSKEELKKIKDYKKDHYPIIVLSLRSGTRQWVDQELGFFHIIKSLQSEYKNIGFILDGMNTISSEVHSSHGNIDLADEISIAERLMYNNTNIISLVGGSIESSIAWCEISDLFIAPWGAGLAKYKWLNNKKGVVFSSKCILEEKSDLHIYDSEKYLEQAIEDIWINSKYCTNATYATFDEYQEVANPTITYFYQNYECDWKEIYRLASIEIRKLIKNYEF